MAVALGAAACADGQGSAEVVVGSKKFTESVILGELAAQLARSAGAEAQHRRDLGGTRVLWSALLRGDIDVYPEYTGTIVQEILVRRSFPDDAALRAALLERGIVMGRPLGFNNTYAIGMQEARAAALGVRRISDLRKHLDLRFGFTNEFMDRADGWPSLRDAYRLPHRDVRGLDHDLAYRGLESGSIDAMDVYSTDAEIRYYGLRVLEDDAHHFPDYHAVLLRRRDLARRAPGVAAALARLDGRIDATAMSAMNARAKLERVPEGRVAADFLEAHLGIGRDARVESAASRILRNTREHLALVGVSLSAAIALAVPLGVLAAQRTRFGQAILGAVGIVQTIPALALLVVLIGPFGIGGPPAIAALFLYSLLPIVRNTYAGLHDIPIQLRESAEALGLPSAARLRRVELPLAARSILAGVKTSAVINIGTATLGALVGAGGYGQPILTGIRLDDYGLILQGAVPAAVLALVAQGVFELAERWIVPKGLRLAPSE
ncbi:MAG: ABC transporter permease subunit [Deltaproteobacteria bacterium]|nr:MAG: ABC transporter permease subunit [Deltaproteobacteria bacterium]